jgi:hypothetical protein
VLLIAQPKSASTSLMHSISQILKVAHKNGQSRGKADINCEGFEELQKYHSTTVRRSFKYLNNYISSNNIIYKEHILPIQHHLDCIEKIAKPIVVLLRKPEETIESYKRVFSVLPELKNIDYDKLYEEVKLFYDTYLNIESELYLKITFRDVVFNFNKTMMKIINHYKFKIPDNINNFKLEKRNYTGHGLRKIIEEEKK